MTYQEKLCPWMIVRLQPDQPQFIVARFRRRSDAEGRLRILKQTTTSIEFAIAFDSPKAAGE
jgi:hypothetical protein